MKKDWIIYSILIIVIISFLLGQTIGDRRENTNRFIHSVFNDCNRELGYTLNTLHKNIFTVDKEKLEDEEYVYNVFHEAYEDLRLWDGVMGELSILHKEFGLKTDLRHYLAELRDINNLTDEELENLEKIIRISTRINPGKDEIIRGSYRSKISPDKKVWDTLLEINRLSYEGYERIQ